VAYRAGDVPHALDGYGYWIPGAGPGEVSACTWTSSKIPGRAPAGYALLRGYVQGDAGVVSPTAARDVRAELRRTLGITAEPLLERTYHWPVAVPVYGPHHADRSAIVARLPHDSPGLAVAGPAFDGLGMPDCIRSGSAAAEAVWSHVASGVAA
jgi:oxygen-dependent protoporphyrinogen oxidase